MDSEEIMWHQRSKVQWMGLGDRNTKYFHTKASQRKKNTISRIMDGMDTGVILMKALQMWLFLISQSFILPPTQAV